MILLVFRAAVHENTCMKNFLRSVIAIVLLYTAAAAYQKTSAKEEIEAFNKRLDEVTLHMDNAGTLSLWAEDGISLLPSTPPIEGKKALTKFLDDVVAQSKGWKVIQQQSRCHDIETSG